MNWIKWSLIGLAGGYLFTWFLSLCVWVASLIVSLLLGFLPEFLSNTEFYPWNVYFGWFESHPIIWPACVIFITGYGLCAGLGKALIESEKEN